MCISSLFVIEFNFEHIVLAPHHIYYGVVYRQEVAYGENKE